jgi:hypothetical protein
VIVYSSRGGSNSFNLFTFNILLMPRWTDKYRRYSFLQMCSSMLNGPYLNGCSVDVFIASRVFSHMWGSMGLLLDLLGFFSGLTPKFGAPHPHRRINKSNLMMSSV